MDYKSIDYKSMTTMSIIHLWCNGKVDREVSKSNWLFKEFELYYKNKLVAIHYNKNKVLISEFSTGGTFGNDTNYNDIRKAVPSNKVAIVFNKIFKDKNLYNKEWALSEFLKYNKHKLNKVAFFKECICNNRIFTVDCLTLDLNLKNLENFNKKLSKSIQNEKINFRSTYKCYKGWGNDCKEMQSFDINFKLKDFNLEYFFKKDEIEILKMKNWIYKFGKKINTKNIYIHTLKKFKEIWFSDKKEEFCKTIEKIYEDNEIEISNKKLKEKNEKILIALNKIQAFRNNVIDTINNLPYDCVKIINEKIIKTSQGVRLHIEEAKKAFNFFNLKPVVNYKQLIGDFTYLGIKKKVIPYLENEEVKYKTEDCLIIGCHTIPESEINEFINFYKLDWK